MRVWMLGLFLVMVCAVAVVLWWRMSAPRSLSQAEFASRFDQAIPAPNGPVATYHLGHSLVGRDMPAMLAELSGHTHASQLGWGATLKGHWDGDVPGFAEENFHTAFRPAADAIDSGDYGAVVLTEMVELRDAVRYFDSPRYLALWTKRALTARPNARVYLYETWHQLDDPQGWLNRLDKDLTDLWEGAVLRVAMAQEGVGTIYVIPGGQVMAAVARAIEAGQVPGLQRREQLFATTADGSTDMIHLNDLGSYVVALTHYAVIYHRSPEGLTADLLRADGTPIEKISPETALALQRIVWTVVTGYAPTGVASDQAGFK